MTRTRRRPTAAYVMDRSSLENVADERAFAFEESNVVDRSGAFRRDLAADPTITLFEYDYEQTPASVADVADEVRSLRGQVLLAKVWVPVALAAIAVLALIVGLILMLRRRGRRGLEVIEPPDLPVESRPIGDAREPATVGRSHR